MESCLLGRTRRSSILIAKESDPCDSFPLVHDSMSSIMV